MGEPPAIAAELAQAVAARQPSRVAIAPTRPTARLLTLAHAELTVVDGDDAAALAALPLVHLQQLVAEAAGTTLPPAPGPPRSRAAVRAPSTGAALGNHDAGRSRGAARRRSVVAARAAGVALQRLARGLDPRPFVPDRDVPRFIGRLELEWPIDALEPLSFVFARLLDPLSAALERADRGAAAIRLDLRLVDRTRARPRAAAAGADARPARAAHAAAARSRVASAAAPPSTSSRSRSIRRRRASRSSRCSSARCRRRKPSPRSPRACRRWSGRRGCGSAVLLDSHRPDAFEMPRFEPDGQRCGAGPDRPMACGAKALRRRCQRCRRPTGASPPVLRRFRPPVAVRVTVEHGRPVQRGDRPPWHAAAAPSAQAPGRGARRARGGPPRQASLGSRRMGRRARRRHGLPHVPGSRHRDMVPGGRLD